MKLFDNSNFVSQLFRIVFLVLLTYKFTDILLLIFPQQYLNLNTGVAVLFYVLSYLVLMKIYELLFNLILILSYYNKYHILTIILLFLLLPTNIEFSIKALKMIYLIRHDSEKIIKYFDDNNDAVKCYALLLYGAQIDTVTVLNWFEERYIRKGIPIDSNFFPLYELFVS